ncbi:MAG: primosomal protein N' [Phycisphaerales bacterium]|nr:primosomal protein N' [Phycisphaerales bacterium]
MEGLFPQATTGLVRVAVERGLDRYPDGLTYALDEDLADVAVGERVIVPLGRGNTPTGGYVVERLSQESAPPRTKHVLRRDETAPDLPADLLSLADWIATYYLAPLGLTIANMLPSAVRKGTGSTTLRLVSRASDPPGEGKRPTAKQKQVLDTLDELPASQRPVERRSLADMAGLGTCGPIDRLVAAGVLVETRQTAIEAAWHSAAPVDSRMPTPTPAQQTVIDAIAAERDAGFSTHLLRGVTGSGKTEVYLRLIDQTLQAGQIALMLVPEIALTPQTGGRLTGRFPDRRIAVLHSGLTDAQRNQQWARVARDDVDIVLGARSAVLAPIRHERLGLVVVDEEHDQSYKQDSTPRYHGRDTAIRLAQMSNCPAVLGSATPSIESWCNATERGVYRLHELQDRAPGLTVPRIRLLDMAQERRRQLPGQSMLIGPTLDHALQETLQSDGQALLLLNRRGFASYVACRNQKCGWMLCCDQCDVTMVMHRHRELPRGGLLRCHHCLSECRVPKSCAACGGPVAALGQGTQRIEEVLAARFPELRPGETLQRIDSDTMRRVDDLHEVLAAFGAGRIRVLLGTQMIAKGLDYPGVRLVGVIDADTAIHLPDFRASERTYQLVAQVCGRCGRGGDAGTALIQTYNPDAPAIRLAAERQYRAFADAELVDRSACGLPPARRMARIVIQDHDRARCTALAATMRERLEAFRTEAVEIRGPTECVIARIAQRFRRQIELFAPSARALHQVLAEARAAGLLDTADRTTIDMDPMSLM